MNILHITTHLNKGGIASYLSSLAIGLNKRDHSVTISSSGGDLKNFILENGIRHLHIPIRTKSELSLRVLFSYFILSRFIANNRVDIIHAHTRVAQVLSWFLSKRYRIPLVTTCHGFFRPRWNRRKFPCWGDKTIAISSQVKSHLIFNFGVKEEYISLIHNGVDLSKFQERTLKERNSLKREIGIPKDVYVVGVAARFSTVKGLEYLIKSVLEVIKENNNVIFLLIGSGKEELRLRQIARDLKVDSKVIFFTPREDAYKYICVIDIFVLPSIQEGLGLSILEAQAQKIPVIASNIGGIPDIIEDNITGLLVPIKNESAISEAILNLVNNRDLYAAIKNSAYNKIVRQFTLEQMIIKTERVYRELYEI